MHQAPKTSIERAREAMGLAPLAEVTESIQRAVESADETEKGSFLGVVFGLVLLLCVLFIGAFFIFSALGATDSGVAVGYSKATHKTIYVLRQNEPVLFYLTTAAVFLVGAAVVIGLLLLLMNGGDVQISTSRPMRLLGQALMNIFVVGLCGYLVWMSWEPIGRYSFLAILVASIWRLNSPGVSLIRPSGTSKGTRSGNHE